MHLRRNLHRKRGDARQRLRGRRRPKRTAFVLSGGGVLGAIQVGQIQALTEAGIVPDVIVGTSVGAINGAALASDPTPEGAERLRAVWSSLRTEDLFPGSRMQRALQLVRRGDHLYDNAGIRRLVALLPARSFEELLLPLHVGATNLGTGREHWLWSGALEPAILASSAIPGVFPPVALDGEMLVDGGVANNVPISRAVELGATKIYVLACGAAFGERPIRNPLDVFVQAVARTRAAKLGEEVARYGERAEITVLPTVDPGPIRFNDLSQTSRLIAEAADATRDHLGTSPAVVTLAP